MHRLGRTPERVELRQDVLDGQAQFAAVVFQEGAGVEITGQPVERSSFESPKSGGFYLRARGNFLKRQARSLPRVPKAPAEVRHGDKQPQYPYLGDPGRNRRIVSA